jgi:hypothetical protein
MVLDAPTGFFSQILSLVVIESYIGAFSGEYFAECRADAARTSAYERALSFKQAHQLVFS